MKIIPGIVINNQRGVGGGGEPRADCQPILPEPEKVVKVENVSQFS